MDDDWTDYADSTDPAFLGTMHPASDEAVQAILAKSDEDDDGRSEWLWIRLRDGGLILGTWPQGDTYFEVEVDAETPGNLRKKGSGPAQDAEIGGMVDLSKCPVCGKTELRGDIPDINADYMSQEIKCGICFTTFREVYVFNTREDIKPLGIGHSLTWTAQELAVHFGSAESVFQWADQHKIDLPTTFDLTDDEFAKLRRMTDDDGPRFWVTDTEQYDFIPEGYMGLVDEQEGGIVAYGPPSNLERLAEDLNANLS